jgi:glycosyltransferase involved in cell wall biosynthesis
MPSSRRKPVLVISGINLTEGGPLSVFDDCLHAASRHFSDQFEVIALVHRAGLFSVPKVRFLEFPRSKRSWLLRLYYEYSGFARLSRELDPDFWLSLHDLTPNVQARRQAVYCHNPAPFHRLRAREVMLQPVFALFNLFYLFAYRVNIRRNAFLVVQQDWLRREFAKMFDPRRIIVAHPKVTFATTPPPPRRKGRLTLVYPSLARVHKNFEVACEAVRLVSAEGVDVELQLTINGDENRYARYLRRRFGRVTAIRFLGRKSRAEVFDLYASADALVFPSRLETWGLPLTEFSALGKPILVSELPYAHETLNGYGPVKYFDPEQPAQLADVARALADGSLAFDGEPYRPPDPPFAEDWRSLLALMLDESSPEAGR